MSQTIRIEHLARVEGHGGVTVELDGGRVDAVRFDVLEGARLLEALVRGRGYEDVAGIVSRICAICSTAHTLTSLKATENAFGVRITPQTELLRDLLYRGESIESHALHLFCLALPDYLGYPSAVALAADHPDEVKLGLRLKKLGNRIQETIGGRAIHPVNPVVGGFARLPSTEALIGLRDDLRQAVSEVDVVLDLLAFLPPPSHADLAFAALKQPSTYGYYAGEEIVLLSDGVAQTFPAAEYRALANERAVPHSHAKHSSFSGRPFMVGSLARLAINLELLEDGAVRMLERIGLTLPSRSALDNNKAQAVELALDIRAALDLVEWLLKAGLQSEPPAEVRPRAATGTGITEAPRGLLVHSYTYDEQGRVAAADVITPTAFNAASVEERLRLLVEQEPDKSAASLTPKMEMLVRAYDPCISCSVHLIEKRHAV